MPGAHPGTVQTISYNPIRQETKELQAAFSFFLPTDTVRLAALENERAITDMRQQKITISRNGFTLVEMLMALAIGAIVLSYGLPGWMEFVRNQRLHSAQTQLASSLAFARGYAIREHVYVIVCPGDDTGCNDGNSWHNGWVAFEDHNRNREKDPEDRLILRENALYNGVHILSSVHRARLRFNTLGLAPGSNASLWLCDMRGHQSGRRIVVSNSGRTRLQNHTDRCQ